MRRYWLDAEPSAHGEYKIEGETLHHIRDVCRQHVGSKFEILLPSGAAHLVEVIEEQKRHMLVQVLETRSVAPLRFPHIHLALSLPKFPVFEAVIEKSVELGVHSVRPFFSDYSFLRGPDSSLVKKKERWNKIVLGATQQSGRGSLMPILEAEPLSKMLQEFNRNELRRGLFAYEGQGEQSLAGLIGDWKTKAEFMRSGEVWIFVGSEGGFSTDEVETFRKNGLKPVSIGDQVLRVETACVALTSIIKYSLELA